jgi:hypothetical protein
MFSFLGPEKSPKAEELGEGQRQEPQLVARKVVRPNLLEELTWQGSCVVCVCVCVCVCVSACTQPPQCLLQPGSQAQGLKCSLSMGWARGTKI